MSILLHPISLVGKDIINIHTIRDRTIHFVITKQFEATLRVIDVQML